jgi:hypothetical protein
MVNWRRDTAAAVSTADFKAVVNMTAKSGAGEEGPEKASPGSPDELPSMSSLTNQTSMSLLYSSTTLSQTPSTITTPCF